MDTAASSSVNVSGALVTATGCATAILASGLAYVIMRTKSAKNIEEDRDILVSEAVEESLDPDIYFGGQFTVYYGSQTGTAESFARQIEREGESHGFKVHVVDLEDIEEIEEEENAIRSFLCKEKTRNLNGEHRAVFLMATYGEGEPTDNAASFSNLLKNIDQGYADLLQEGITEEKKIDGEDNEKQLKDVDYAVFGLGNTQYEQYNAMGKLVDGKMESSGANRIIGIGLGNDNDDLEDDFESWKQNRLWPSLTKKYVSKDLLKTKKSGTKKSLPSCPYSVEYLNSETKADYTPSENIHFSGKHYFTAVDCPISLKRELRSSTDAGSTLHLEIDISSAGDKIKYQTADNLGILPVNDEIVVGKIADALGYNLNATFKLQASKGFESKYSIPFPNPCTIRELLSRYCDLTMAPRRSDLKQLAAYAKNALCRNALLRISSKEGKAEYKEKVVESHYGIVDVISTLCPSIEMPLEHFISICPRLLPRYYTISSSATVHSDSIHATVSVLRSDRKDGGTFKGVCSNYLADMVLSKNVRVFCRSSSFRLPPNPETPIIMIGPGTGVAPMRALLQERFHMKNKQKLTVGSNILYFGCKNRTDDYLYSDELDSFQKDGVLTKLYLAFSREQKEKIYVQHILKNNGKETWDLINSKGAYVYVCGGVQMGQDVSETLRCIISDGLENSADAKLYLDRMTKEGRLVQELWA